MTFAVDPAIEAVTVPLAPLNLCEARLMQDARFVWVVLIPRHPGAVEIDDLTQADQALLFQEAVKAGAVLRSIAEALGRPIDKLNTAALGNITRQLHIHIVGRRTDDAAWPRPVWGVGDARAWSADESSQIEALWRASAP